MSVFKPPYLTDNEIEGIKRGILDKSDEELINIAKENSSIARQEEHARLKGYFDKASSSYKTKRELIALETSRTANEIRLSRSDSQLRRDTLKYAQN